MMKLSDFDYNLPKELIAQHPLKERDSSKMLVLHKKTGAIEHKVFYNLPEYLSKNDLVVLNDTKVFKARLLGKRKGFTGKIELLILKQTEKNIFECLVKPAKRFKPGTKLEFGNNGKIRASVVNFERGLCFIEFDNNSLKDLDGAALTPLPPYIKRLPSPEDEARYQTIYARAPGAIAAPTAGLHFTHSVIDSIKGAGADTAHITLHVGYGTFQSVKNDDITKHKMHSEYFEIPQAAAEKINKAKQANSRILAVGTTSCRTLESAAALRRTKGETDLFIYPGYSFKMTDMLLTNFHLPKTTLIMLVSAFGGYDFVVRAYKEAIEKGYRFYSYGDCMLIL